MSIQRDPDGRRFVRVETEVPGTPEQVWRAIATGPGISAWFVPATVEEKDGGAMSFDFGGGMLSSSTITAFEPPFRLAAESPGWMPDMPPMATEWTVEAKSGGTCLVRVVHSMFASTDDWDDQLESTETGWPAFFDVLRRYLEHFAGQRSAIVQAVAMSSDTVDAAWSKLAAALGTTQPRQGQKLEFTVAPGVTLGGELLKVTSASDKHSVQVALTEPAPGTLMVGAFGCGGVMASLQAWLYGPEAEAVAAEIRPPVQQWLQEQIPPPAAP